MRAEEDDVGAIDSQEEENYFVSLTDLMTGVVFIFVILLVTYALTFHSAQKELEKEREHAASATTALEKEREHAASASMAAAKAEEQAKEFRDSAQKAKEGLDRELYENRRKAEQIDSLAKVLKQREEQRKKILEDVVTRLEKRGVRVSLDPENGIIRLPEEMLFDSAQATLRPGAAQALNTLAVELSSVLEKWCSPREDFRLEAVFIEGHTDSNPIRTARFSDNWELSTSRAVNISRALLQTQPGLSAFKNPKGMPVLGVSGYGENRPVADNASDEGRRRNRRIDLRFLLAYPTDEQVSKATGGLNP